MWHKCSGTWEHYPKFVLGMVLYQDYWLAIHRVNPPKVWSPPGGYVREKSPWESVVMEIAEETGIVSPDYRIVVGSWGKGLVYAFTTDEMANLPQENPEWDGIIWTNNLNHVELSPPIEWWERAREEVEYGR